MRPAKLRGRHVGCAPCLGEPPVIKRTHFIGRAEFVAWSDGWTSLYPLTWESPRLALDIDLYVASEIRHRGRFSDIPEYGAILKCSPQ